MRKKYFYFTILLVFCLSLLSGIILAQYASPEIIEKLYLQEEEFSLTISSLNNLNLPLPKPSQISFEKDKIRLDLEKISANKFFIVYSVVYGNQSHTAYHLYLSNLNKEKINKDDIQEVYLETKDGEIIKPLAQKLTINDFPEDLALEWKVKIIAKLPYKTQRASHNLVLVYQDKEYILTEIYY